MKQKLLILICTIMAACSAYALEFNFENDDVNLRCTTTSDNTCKISGGYSKNNILTIPETVEYQGQSYTVTSIGNNAFAACYYNQIILPNTLLNIENSAFALNDIITLEIPNSVLSIGNYAFNGCKFLETLTIGNSVQYIGDLAFNYCSSLLSVTIPESVETMGYDIFGNGKNLNAFYGKFASEDNRCLIVDGVLNSFAPAGLETYEIPSTVTSIGSSAFSYIRGLKLVTIPESVTSIEDYAFSSCESLTSINIPMSVAYIGDGAFAECTSLESLKVENDDPANITVYYDTFRGSYENCVLYVPEGSESLYASTAPWNYFGNIKPYVTSGVESVEAFAGCDEGYYDLCGRKVANPVKGIFIHNGKKTYFK